MKLKHLIIGIFAVAMIVGNWYLKANLYSKGFEVLKVNKLCAVMAATDITVMVVLLIAAIVISIVPNWNKRIF